MRFVTLIAPLQIYIHAVDTYKRSQLIDQYECLIIFIQGQQDLIFFFFFPSTYINTSSSVKAETNKGYIVCIATVSICMQHVCFIKYFVYTDTNSF